VRDRLGQEASSTPAMWSHPIEAEDSGLICCGLVRGISFTVRHRKKTISAMNSTGAQVSTVV
jgi:hypothetical protein